MPLDSHDFARGEREHGAEDAPPAGQYNLLGTALERYSNPIAPQAGAWGLGISGEYPHPSSTVSTIGIGRFGTARQNTQNRRGNETAPRQGV